MMFHPYPYDGWSYLMHVPIVAVLMTFFAVRMLIVASNRSKRRPANRPYVRTCASCGTPHPPHARFCRSCGRGL